VEAQELKEVGLHLSEAISEISRERHPRPDGDAIGAPHTARGCLADRPETAWSCVLPLETAAETANRG
jgi:hypothetical protein